MEKPKRRHTGSDTLTDILYAYVSPQALAYVDKTASGLGVSRSALINHILLSMKEYGPEWDLKAKPSLTELRRMKKVKTA